MPGTTTPWRAASPRDVYKRQDVVDENDYPLDPVVELFEPALLHRLFKDPAAALEDHLVEQGLFVGKIEVKSPLGDPRPAGDLVDGGLAEPLFAEQVVGRLLQPLFFLLFLVLDLVYQHFFRLSFCRRIKNDDWSLFLQLLLYA